MSDSTHITDAPGHSTGEAGQGSPRRRDTFVRYTPSDRTNHWMTAIAFVLAGLSGLAMFHPALFGLSALFGGGPWTRILHPFIGLFMVGAFAFLAVRFWSHNYMQPADWKWMRQYRDVISNREDRLPEVGRYKRRAEAALLGHRAVPGRPAADGPSSSGEPISRSISRSGWSGWRRWCTPSARSC